MCFSLSVVDPLLSSKTTYLLLKIIVFPKYFKVSLALFDVFFWLFSSGTYYFTSRKNAVKNAKKCFMDILEVIPVPIFGLV